MSSFDRYDTRRRRPLYGPGPSSRRSTLGYWVPLVLTVTVATAGLVAWIWSERQNGDDDDDDEYDEHTNDEQERPEYPPRPAPGGSQGPSAPGPDSGFDGPPPLYPGSVSRSAGGEDEGFFSRVSGAVRRSPSPQQFFDSAGQRLAAGVAAASAAVGLRSITEEEARIQEGDSGFSDHERWSEEAESKRVEAQIGTKGASRDAQAGRAKPRRTVAIVVSAESSLVSLHEEEHVEYRSEHAVRCFSMLGLMCYQANSVLVHLVPSASTLRPGNNPIVRSDLRSSPEFIADTIFLTKPPSIALIILFSY